MYKLNRYEKIRDHAGVVTGIFISVSGDTGSQEHWLTADEVAAVLASETALQPILEKTCAEMEIRLTNELATKPQPAIIADQIKMNSFVINPLKVTTQITSLKIPVI